MLVGGEGLTARSRAFAEARMLDTCRITRSGTGERVLDPVTRKYVDPDPVVVYEGKCRIKSQSAAVTDAAAGEATWDVQQSILHVPVAETVAVAAGNTVTYLTAADDPGLIGREYGVTGPDNDSAASDRRLLLNRVV